MPQQARPVNDWVDVTDDWQDVTEPQSSVAASTKLPEPEPGWFDTAASYIPESVKSGWNALWEPLSDLPSRAVSVISEPLMSYGESGTDWTRKPALYGGAFAQSVGDVLSGLTSPGNIATTLATGGTGLAAKAALPKVAQTLATGAKIGGGLTATHGLTQIANPEATMFERGLGALETVGGGLAARTKARVPPKGAAALEELPVKQPTAPITPEAVTPESLPVRPAPEAAPTPGSFGAERWTEIQDKIASGIATEDDFVDLEVIKRANKSAPRIPTPKPGEFDPSTLKGLGPTSKPEVEFVNPNTGEVKPASLAEPGDVPVIPETSVAPEITPEPISATKPHRARNMILTKKASEAELAKPTTTGTADDIAESLNQRLQKVVDDAGKPNPAAPEEISKLLDEAAEVTKINPDVVESGVVRQVLGANKALLTSWDLSALGRQGKAFIFNKAWWTSLDDMVKAWGSKAAADSINQSILDHPSGYFKRGVTETGKSVPSFAEKVGLDLTSTEEMFNATLGQAFERYSLVGKSSRAHTAFLNKLRSDQFVSMMNGAKKAGFNPETDIRMAKAYAKFINDGTGRGSVNIGKWKLERNIGVLNDVFFAPKNMSGQIRTWNNVLNPVKYYNYDPVLRKQALRSLFAIAGMGLGVGEVARLAGGKVSNDPTSSDFRKIKIGDIRIDLFGGYQQFPVAAMKLMLGESTSTITNRTTDLTGNKFGQQTRQSVAERFFTNRLSPLGSFIWAWMGNREFDGKPFEVKRALYERVFPIAAKDILDIAKEDPALAAALVVPTTTGLTGTQTYTGR